MDRGYSKDIWLSHVTLQDRKIIISTLMQKILNIVIYETWNIKRFTLLKRKHFLNGGKIKVCISLSSYGTVYIKQIFSKQQNIKCSTVRLLATIDTLFLNCHICHLICVVLCKASCKRAGFSKQQARTASNFTATNRTFSP